MFTKQLTLLGLAALSSAANLASTTRYYDGQMGACGCGTSSGMSSWQLGIGNGVYTAAASQALFDTSGSSWCGGGCGKCYNLTATGSSACSTCGTGTTAGKSIIVMVTNLCPNSGNEQWCPAVGGKNQYGYSYHFDIMAQSQVFGDNPVVQFEEVACPSAATQDWHTCQCYGDSSSSASAASGSSSSSKANSASSSSQVKAADPTSSSTAAAAEPTTPAPEPAPADPTTTASGPAAEPTTPVSTLSTIFTSGVPSANPSKSRPPFSRSGTHSHHRRPTLRPGQNRNGTAIGCPNQ